VVVYDKKKLFNVEEIMRIASLEVISDNVQIELDDDIAL
jgi:hypothetical protein